MSNRNKILNPKTMHYELQNIKIENLEKQIAILQAEKALLTKLVLKLGGVRGSNLTLA